jgi:small basic protein (TIGR04137 family)
MTIDKTLKVARGLARSRSVLTRAERLVRLKDGERWSEGDSPVGLPKVRVFKLSMKKKKKEKKDEDAAAAPAKGAAAKAGAAKPAAAAAAKPAAKPAAKK